MFNIRLIAIALCLPLALFCGCSKDQSAPGASPAAAAADCNVLLITMDTTRADYLGCYGHPGNLTPTLDELARSGVRFENALTDAPVTVPAHASLMTGALPPEHGLRDNSRFALGPDLPTLAEAYREHGYRTIAIIAAPVLKARCGLNRGFDVYNDAPPPPDHPQNSWTADIVCERAVAALNQVRDQRFFCWVHLFDPHAPYAPPQPYFEKAGGDPYGGEVAFMDTNIGHLIRWLDDNNLRQRTLVVAMADHGEGLSDHGYMWHALLLYNELVRVPLIMSLPGRLPQGQTRGDLVSIVDIMPTLLDLAGWPTPPTVSGLSLAPVIAGKPGPDRAIYGETQDPFYSFGWSPLYSLTTPQWTYIRAPRPELYDRGADPDQMQDLAGQRPELVAQLEQQLHTLEGGMRLRTAHAAQTDSAQQRALRSLGYVGDSPTPATCAAGLKNPRDMVKVEYNFRVAESLASQAPAEAIKVLEPAVEQSPESFSIVHLLGTCYGLVKRLDESQLTLTHALELYPESTEAALDLALTLAGRGRVAHAVELCQQVLQREPNEPRGQQMLPWLLDGLRRMQTDTAALQLSRDKEGPASDPELVRKLADLLAASGRRTEAVDTLREACQASPDNPLLVSTLAWYRATVSDDKLRDGQQALTLAQQALASGQRDPRMIAALAAAYAETGQFEEAARTARQIKTEFAADQRIPLNLDFQIRQYEAGRPYRELP